MQYYYLVCTVLDETCCPRKIFLQEHQAEIWGRRYATRIKDDDFYWGIEVVLYKQPITTTGELEYVKELEPYDREVISPEELNKDLAGSDYDIDIKRPGDPGIDTTFG